MYETIIIPKKFAEHSIDKMAEVAKKYASSDMALEQNENSVILRKGDSSFTISYLKDSIVLEENKEMAERHGIPVENIDFRYTTYGRDDDDILYNQFLLIYEDLRDSNLYYILDCFDGKLTGKNTPLNEYFFNDFFYADPFLTSLEKEIADLQQKKFNSPKNNYNTEPRNMLSRINDVKWVGIQNFEDLMELYHSKRNKILDMADRFITRSDVIFLGASMKFLCFEVIAASRDLDKITAFVRERIDEENYEKLSKAIYKVYPK